MTRLHLHQYQKDMLEMRYFLILYPSKAHKWMEICGKMSKMMQDFTYPFEYVTFEEVIMIFGKN